MLVSLRQTNSESVVEKKRTRIRRRTIDAGNNKRNLEQKEFGCSEEGMYNIQVKGK